MYKTLFCLIVCLSNSNLLTAQQFSFGPEERISPLQLLPQNYLSISIENGNRIQSNFNSLNPDTFLQLVYDEKGIAHHVLYQTAWNGKLSFLAISKELENIFYCKRSTGIFNFCMNKTKQFEFTQDVNKSILGCVLKQLNSCQ